MREYKFRGKIKNPKVNKWIYGYLADDYHISEKNELGYIPIRKETIGQYTGLKDKNGKEIYEGDIVQAVFTDEKELEMKGVVIYVEASACYMVIANNGDEWELGYLDEIEKIGNKWDNPELLEEGEKIMKDKKLKDFLEYLQDKTQDWYKEETRIAIERFLKEKRNKLNSIKQY